MSASAQIERDFTSAPQSTRLARAFVTDELVRLGAPPATLSKLDLIVSELMANSIQYGDGSNIVVLVDATSPAWYTVTVCNGLHGQRPPMNPAAWAVAANDLPSGRGLGIIAQLADDVIVDEHAGQLHITCRLRR